MDDTLLFGGKVLSLPIPGSLTRKNISEIQNSIVDGVTTWKHQNVFAKMMIAGCMTQAKKILENFDEVLYGRHLRPLSRKRTRRLQNY